jgi:site-specific DNA-methyltransferase (adenine-specific)
MPRTPTINTLFYGDNLDILRDEIGNETVDLVYLDPPFNSNATYNVLFKAPTGEQSQAQIEAFEDTWHWNSAAEAAFDRVIHSGNSDATEMLRAMRSFLKENDMMAYLAMMAVRLIELHRVLKPTGSLYLHCDPTASHYLKILLDAVFSFKNYRNEITWKRSTSHGNVGRNYGSLTDAVFFYTKTDGYIWNQQYAELSDEYVETKFRNRDADGRLWQSVSLRNPGVRPNLQYLYKATNGVTYKPHPNGWAVGRERMEQYDRDGRLHFPTKPDGQLRLKQYLDERPGTKLQNIWDDIPAINSQAQERLGYPTQKPLALLERIISASSNEGDLVLDPFCGCGTTVHAAQKLNRRWIGIDITHLAISLVKRRLIDAFPMAKFEIHGVPKDIGAARELARTDPHQFQLWAVAMIEAQPYKGGKKGGDTGIDGYLYFKPDGKLTEKAVVSVKGGQNLNPNMVRDLAGTVEAERAKMGIFVTLEDPTTGMRTAALRAGYYETDYGKYEKIQILTVEDLFDGKKPHMPWADPSVFKKAKRETMEKQSEMDL